MDVRVVNRPNKGQNGAVYIGRGGRGIRRSPLANPRRIGDPKPGGGWWERGETIALFEQDLRAVLDPTAAHASWWDGIQGNYRVLTREQREEILTEVARPRALARTGTLELDCFCSPEPCHGDVIRRIVLEPAGHAEDRKVRYPVTGWTDDKPYTLQNETELINAFSIHVTDCTGHPDFVDADGRNVVFAITPEVVAG